MHRLASDLTGSSQAASRDHQVQPCTKPLLSSLPCSLSPGRSVSGWRTLANNGAMADNGAMANKGSRVDERRDVCCVAPARLVTPFRGAPTVRDVLQPPPVPTPDAPILVPWFRSAPGALAFLCRMPLRGGEARRRWPIFHHPPSSPPFDGTQPRPKRLTGGTHLRLLDPPTLCAPRRTWRTSMPRQARRHPSRLPSTRYAFFNGGM